MSAEGINKVKLVESKCLVLDGVVTSAAKAWILPQDLGFLIPAGILGCFRKDAKILGFLVMLNFF